MVPTWLKTLFPRRSSRSIKAATRTRPAARPGLVQLEDRAVPATISIADPVAIAEGNTGTQTLMFTVTANKAEAANITFKINTADGTATAGNDYLALTDVAGTILAGQTTTKVMVTINGDKTVELDEDFTVTLSDLSVGNTFTDDTATGTITNDDKATVSISGPSEAEGTALSFTVTIDNPVDVDVTADRKTADGTALAASDYTALANANITLFTANSAANKSIVVTTSTDSLVELDETLSLILSNLAAGGRNVVFAGGGSNESDTGTILNNDQAIISISSPSIAEGGNLAFQVTIDNTVDTAITADRKTADGTASSANDYTAIANSNITLFAANSGTTKVVNVVTTGDSLVELDETVSAILTSLSAGGRNVIFAGNVATLTGTGTILNNDQAKVSISSPTVTEGGTLAFSVTIDNKVDFAVSANRKTQDGTAVAPGDYTAIADGAVALFAANTSTAFTINVTTKNDNIVEATELMSVVLSSLTAGGRDVIFNGGGATESGTGTINSDDTAQFTISATASATEGNTVDFTVTLTNPASVATSVTVTTTDGSATSPQDFVALSGTLVSFPAGATSKTVSVTTKDNKQVDGTRQFTIDLGGLNDGGLTGKITIDAANDNGTGSILDNDKAEFSIANATVAEGGTVMFMVTLSAAVTVNTSVTVTTADLTADSADYTGVSNMLVSFPAGTTSVPVMIATKADAIVEADETFKITLGNLVNGGNTDVMISATNGTATGTITNDDSTTLTVDDVTVAEAAGSAKFTVSLTNGVQGGFSVQYKTVASTAKDGSDYTGKTGTLNFTGTPGETQSFSVTILDNNVVELDEQFSIELFNVVPTNVLIPAGNIVATDTALGKITNDDTTKLTLADSSATEGTAVTFTASLTNPVDTDVTITLTPSKVGIDSATETADFSTAAKTITILAGNLTGSTTVATAPENIVETDETFTATLSNVTASGREASIISVDLVAAGTIVNDDSAAFSIANASVSEGGTITFTITLSNPVSTATSVTVTTADLTAVDGVDYTGLGAGVTVNFAALATSGTVDVLTSPDTVVEADETFKATLGGLVDGGFPGKVTISGVNGSATGTILNDDSTTLTIADLSQAEGAGMMTFTVTLGNAVQGGFKIDLGSLDGTAKVSDGDYGTVSGILTFVGTAGETQDFSVTITDDNKVEADETFTVLTKNVVTLGAGVSAGKIANGTATGKIVNDDSAKFSIVADSAAIEGGMVTFTVSLTNPVDVATSVTVTTTDGSAKSGGPLAFDKDFTAKVASPVLFGANVTSVNVSVATTADNIVELDEIFSIALGDLVNGGRPTVTIDAANDTRIGTITNDDSAQVKISKAIAAVEGNKITFTVSLTNPIDVDTSVEVTTADITASAGVDYTALVAPPESLVTFTALTTSQTISVITNPDVVVEANETFSATLVNLVDGGRPTLTISGTDNVGTGTITNDDKATVITIANITQPEDAGNMVFMVQLSADVQGGFNVDIMTKDGTVLPATVADADYQFSMKTLSFVGMAGETLLFTVPVNPDNKVEADETFTVHLSNLVPNDAKVSPGDIDISSVGTGTIANDDSTTLTVEDVSQAEGAGKMTFTVTLSNPVQGGLKVDFKTFDGTALIADNDYVTSMGFLTFAGTAGESKTFQVMVNDDFNVEPIEFFTAKLSNVVTLGAGVAAGKVDATDEALGNILTDDTAVIDLAASVDTEGKNLVYTVTLTNPISKDITVTFDTLMGVGARPALSGVDFTAVNGKSVTFLAGTTKVTVLVPLTDDRRVEGSEQFDAMISNIVADASVLPALSFGKAQDTATILDNDTAAFSFAADTKALEDNQTKLPVTVTLTITATGTGTVGLDRTLVVGVTDTKTGTAEAGFDYTNVNNTVLTFLAGDFTTISQDAVFDVVEDLNSKAQPDTDPNYNDAEGDETIVFSQTLLNDFTGGNASGTATKFTHTIQSDDEAVRTYDATVAGDYTFVRVGGNLELSVNGKFLSRAAIGTQAALLNGSAGVESATVDYANGSPVPTGGITFNANGPAAGERFIVSGGTFASVANTFTGAQAGTLVLVGTTTDTLNYLNADAIEINAGSVGSLTFQLPAAASQAILEDDGIAGNGISQIRSGNGTFATTKFVNPTGTLTLNPGNPADTLTIAALPDNTSTLIAGSAGNRFATIAQAGTAGSNGDVRYFANAISIADGANLTAAGAVELNATGTVTLGNTKVQGDTVTQTGGGNTALAGAATITATKATGTTILFNGKIDGPGSLETSSKGQSVFVAEIGSTTPLNVATFGSPINADGTTVAGGALNIAANFIAFNAAVSAQNAPIVLTLTGGAATQTTAGTLTTPSLFLNGKGDYKLDTASNLLTSDATDLFVNMSKGTAAVRDDGNFVIGFADPNAPATPITIADSGKLTLTSGLDFTANDVKAGLPALPPSQLTPILRVPGGPVQINPGILRTDFTKDSSTIRFNAEAVATTITIGQPIGSDPANMAKDAFFIRPITGAMFVINGNRPIFSDVDGNGKPVSPFDSLKVLTVGIASTNLIPGAQPGDGTFRFVNTFAGEAKTQDIKFVSIESIGGVRVEAFVVQTGPSTQTTANSYSVRINAVFGDNSKFGGAVTGSGIVTNPFVVTPSLDNSALFTAPSFTFADVNGDGFPELILANGAGDAPIVTVIQGSSVFRNDAAGNPVPINISRLSPTDIVAQFFAFEETFRGGLKVTAADFNNDGRAELVVSPGNSGGPRITVFQILPPAAATPTSKEITVFNNAVTYRHTLANGQLSNPYNFFPYESSFRGGVNVAVGDVNGDGTPDIIAGAGVGGGPRVRVFDGTVDPTLADGVTQNPASTIADFFAYDPGFRGGVFVDAGRFDSDTIADLVTAPGPGGSAHIQVFQGRKNAQPFEVDTARGTEFRKTLVSFFAFEDQPSLLNPQPQRTGVGGVAFGTTASNLDLKRSILVTRPEGPKFEIVKFELQEDGAPVTGTEIIASPLGKRLKVTTDFQNMINILDFNGGIFLGDNKTNPVGFDVLREGGSAGGFA